jgi:hypothetical protein
VRTRLINLADLSKHSRRIQKKKIRDRLRSSSRWKAICSNMNVEKE